MAAVEVSGVIAVLQKFTQLTVHPYRIVSYRIVTYAYTILSYGRGVEWWEGRERGKEGRVKIGCVGVLV